MARYGIPNPNPVGAFAEGLTSGIQAGQEMLARNEAIRYAQEQRKAREQSRDVQKQIGEANINSSGAIPTITTMGQEPGFSGPSATVEPAWVKLESLRAVANGIDDDKTRESKLAQIDRIAMTGAVSETMKARQAMVDPNLSLDQKNQTMIDKLNNAFKYVDSNASQMFKIDGKGRVVDWEGNPVDRAYMDSIALAVTSNNNPTVQSDYLRKIANDAAAQELEGRKVAATEKVAGATEKNAATNAAEQSAMEKYRAASVYVDLLGQYNASGVKPPTLEDLQTAAGKGMTAIQGDPKHAPILTSMPAQVEAATVSILGLNPNVAPADAATVAAVMTGSTFVASLDEDSRDAVEASPYRLEKSPSTQLDAAGNPVDFRVRVVIPGEDGSVQPVTQYLRVTPNLLLSLETKAPPPGKNLEDAVNAAKNAVPNKGNPDPRSGTNAISPGTPLQLPDVFKGSSSGDISKTRGGVPTRK